MDKTMTRFLAILAALTCAASAQTYRTVTADTNNVIRTNFSLVRSQVSDLSGASFAISNITGLQTALDGKVATNGSAAGLTNFPAIVLQTNSSLSAFPAGLLRTNGDGGALTNLPNANLSNAIGVLPVNNGGTGATNASNARAALELGSAATNPASAFQPASTALTNLEAGDASGLTNLPNANLGTATGILGVANGGSGATNAEAARTNFGLVWGGLTNTDAAGFRSALSLGTSATNDASAFQPANANLTNLAANNGGSLTNVSVDLTTVLPAYSNNAGKVLSVATGATNVEWIAVSNTVTDASTLTNFPASILQTNSADGSFPAFLLRTNGSAAGLTSFPTLNQNTTGTASNVTGVIALTNGGTGGTTASNARVNLLPSYTGNASKVLALNSNANDVEWVTQSEGGGGGGTVTSVAMTVPAFLSVSGSPITTNGTFAVSLNTNALPLTNGGTGATNSAGVLSNLGLLVLSDKVILGQSAVVAQNESTVIGAGARSHHIFGTAIGSDAVVTNGNYGTALGYAAVVRAERGIAIGSETFATATNAVQIGNGSNSTASTIQFQSAGTVNATEWGYLANASSQGGYAMTNTAGISGSKTFVAYDGTNYSTNTVTISNGIITGWTP